MSLKQAIKKAITDNSPKYRAIKVWKIDASDKDLDDRITMWIEVTVKLRPKPNKSKVSR